MGGRTARAKVVFVVSGALLALVATRGVGASPTAAGEHEARTSACTEGAVEACTLFAGACPTGTRRCSGGRWGACGVDPPPPPAACSTRCVGGALRGESLFTPVNRQQALRSDWVPADLILVPSAYRHGEVTRMRMDALGHMLRMLRDARGEGRVPVFCGSPYRSFVEQCALFAQNAAQMGCTKANTSSAMAGHSEHQLGTACDLVLADGTMLQGGASVDAWLAQHAYEYGFVESYPEGTQDVTGYRTEPWHTRYLGPKAAALHHRVELAVGRAVSTHEIVASVACWKPSQLADLATDDPADAALANQALCDAYKGLSTCQGQTALLDCSTGTAQLVTCPHRCLSGGRGVSDRCN